MTLSGYKSWTQVYGITGHHESIADGRTVGVICLHNEVQNGLVQIKIDRIDGLKCRSGDEHWRVTFALVPDT